MPNHPHPPDVVARIRKMFLDGVNKSTIARKLGMSRQTVREYVTGLTPKAKKEEAIPVAVCQLPPAFPQSHEPFRLSTAGTWLILSDVHIPYHDARTVELAIKQAKLEQAVGVILNGDILDSHELSDFDREPSAPRYIAELEAGRQFLAYLRSKLPKAKIVFKQGNHEERLGRYVIRHAPALFGIVECELPQLLHLKDHGIEHVGDKRLIKLGRLTVIHGHEFPRTISSPVSPARGFIMRARESVLGGHYHQSSEQHEPTMSGKPQAAWSTGCACFLRPRYMPYNKWNHGFAFVDVDKDGGFSVRNLKVINGELT